jgi:Icc protein
MASANEVIPARSLASVRIIQLTDFHLMVDPNAEIRGICTRDRFDRVLAAVNARHGDADRLVVTGDFTHDEQLATYEIVRGALASWYSRLRMIPGNHDDRTLMRQVFSDRIQELGGRIVFTEELAGWQLIGLDSHVPGKLHGQLGVDQLAWLDQLLQLNRQPTCLFVHHPPIAMQSEWLDQVGLEDADELLATLRRYSHVRLVCTGHVHQERTVIDEQETLEIDSVSPGYRVIDLLPNGEVQTWVARVMI